jgi:hypothetical protein
VSRLQHASKKPTIRQKKKFRSDPPRLPLDAQYASTSWIGLAFPREA